ncbi:MAG: hypothetical protein Q4F29_01325 [Lachnospiraceae bacterium]|nr:hypothetical protein [Lachnospiraceae bacterium]
MTQPITDHAAFLGEAKEAVEKRNQLKKTCGQLRLEEKQLEKQLEAEKKAVDDAIALTVKKRKEEINASYDKEIAKSQERLKKARAKREKAKNQGVKERIAEETADLHAYNKELNGQMKSIFQKDRVPSFCRRTWFYALYMPRSMKEMGLLLLAVLVFFAAVPGGIYFLIEPQVRRSWMLIVIYLLDIVLFGGLYLTVGNHTKMKHHEAIRQGRLIRDTIHSNYRKIRVITNSIRRDRNETIYNLEKFDDEISRTEQEQVELAAKKQEALNTFNTVTQTIISDEIVNNSREKMEQLKESHERALEQAEESERQIKELSLEITDKYEGYIGTEFMQPDKLAELARLIRSGQAANLSDAISQMKAGKSS